MNGKPTLEELCDNRDKDALEADLQGFFESYYVSVDQAELVPEDKLETNDENGLEFDDDSDLDDSEDKEGDDSDDKDDDDPDDNDKDDEDPDDNDKDDDDPDDIDGKVDVKDLRQRPKGNTSLAYKSHLKQLIKGFTNREYDITDKDQFPEFFVSKSFTTYFTHFAILAFFKN